MGLMLGLKCVDGVTAADIVARLRDRGLLTVGAGDNVVRIMPPLIVEDHHMEEAVAILEGATEGIEPAKAAKS